MFSFEFFKFKVLGFTQPSYKATKCNHVTKQGGKICAFGGKTMTIMPLDTKGLVDWCLDCLGKMAIQCAWCSNTIFIGDPITLYVPRDGDKFEIPKHAIVYNDNPNLPRRFVGCLNCSDIGGATDRAGFWLPGDNGEGYVKRVATPYELIVASGNKSAVFIQDCSDIAEAEKPTVIQLPS